MKASLAVRALLSLVVLAWFGTALPQTLEIVTLHYRTAEQLLPQLLPMLEPGAAMTGTGDKLFVRTSARNLTDLRRVIDQLDRMPRRLVIAVRQGASYGGDSRGAEVSGDVSLGRNVRIISGSRGEPTGTVEIRRGGNIARGSAYETRETGRDDVSQQVQTVEGGRAWISIGQSVPLPLRQMVMTPRGPVVSETVVWRDVGTGFYAEPHVSGDWVTLEISPSRDVPGPAGSADIQRLSTTISGRLGEWIELGGAGRESAHAASGMADYGTRESRDDRRVYVRVTELP
ncbi:MAG TPA: hypothetical protein VF816_12840 [Rhodocyclaceae bacterium]